MSAQLILALLGSVYRTLLRDLIVKAVSDPNSEFDDILLGILDGLFAYKE